MYQIGISSCCKIINAELFEEYSKHQINHIEISESNYDDFDFKNTDLIAKKYGVNIWSLHLPFFPFDEIDISSKAIRQTTVDTLSEIIKKGADTGIDKFVVHPSGEPLDASERTERLKYSKESLSELADICEQCGGVICVENLPRTCLGNSIEEMKLLTAEDERVKICFDTNHLLKEKPEAAIRELGDKIVTLHVSDFDFVNERHWLPGEGKINWKALMEALKSIKYDGVFMYEIGFEAPATIIRSRNLTAADFRNNANELFNGEELTVFSTPKPNLGMWE